MITGMQNWDIDYSERFSGNREESEQWKALKEAFPKATFSVGVSPALPKEALVYVSCKSDLEEVLDKNVISVYAPKGRDAYLLVDCMSSSRRDAITKDIMPLLWCNDGFGNHERLKVVSRDNISQILRACTDNGIICRLTHYSTDEHVVYVKVLGFTENPKYLYLKGGKDTYFERWEVCEA